MPSVSARPSRRPGAPTSDPLGPPTNTTTSLSASPGDKRSSEAAACSTTSGPFSGWIRPAKTSTTASAGSPSRRRAARAGPGRNTDRSTPGLTVSTRQGLAPYSSTSWRASSAVLATSRSAAATTSPSPRILISGSAQSPPARARFLTLPRVCMDWMRGTPQRSAAAAATWPDSQ